MNRFLKTILNFLPSKGDLIHAIAISVFMLIAIILIFSTDESWRF